MPLVVKGVLVVLIIVMVIAVKSSFSGRVMAAVALIGAMIYWRSSQGRR